MMRQIRRPASRSSFPTADEIADRAYALFIIGGRRVARMPEYWRIAETELLEHAASEVVGQPVDGREKRGLNCPPNAQAELSRSKR